MTALKKKKLNMFNKWKKWKHGKAWKMTDNAKRRTLFLFAGIRRFGAGKDGTPTGSKNTQKQEKTRAWERSWKWSRNGKKTGNEKHIKMLFWWKQNQLVSISVPSRRWQATPTRAREKATPPKGGGRMAAPRKRRKRRGGKQHHPKWRGATHQHPK